VVLWGLVGVRWLIWFICFLFCVFLVLCGFIVYCFGFLVVACVGLVLLGLFCFCGCDMGGVVFLRGVFVSVGFGGWWLIGLVWGCVVSCCGWVCLGWVVFGVNVVLLFEFGFGGCVFFCLGGVLWWCFVFVFLVFLVVFVGLGVLGLFFVVVVGRAVVSDGVDLWCRCGCFFVGVVMGDLGWCLRVGRCFVLCVVWFILGVCFRLVSICGCVGA